MCVCVCVCVSVSVRVCVCSNVWHVPLRHRRVRTIRWVAPRARASVRNGKNGTRTHPMRCSKEIAIHYRVRICESVRVPKAHGCSGTLGGPSVLRARLVLYRPAQADIARRGSDEDAEKTMRLDPSVRCDVPSREISVCGEMSVSARGHRVLRTSSSSSSSSSEIDTTTATAAAAVGWSSRTRSRRSSSNTTAPQLRRQHARAPAPISENKRYARRRRARMQCQFLKTLELQRGLAR